MSSHQFWEWGAKGACKNHDSAIFFPENESGARRAKSICQLCEVKDRCREVALDRRERVGVWGGLTERERRKILTARESSQ